MLIAQKIQNTFNSFTKNIEDFIFGTPVPRITQMASWVVETYRKSTLVNCQHNKK
jgi:hypothetical protein